MVEVTATSPSFSAGSALHYCCMLLPLLLLLVVGMISCYHHLHLASYCGQRHVGDLGWRLMLIEHYHHCL